MTLSRTAFLKAAGAAGIALAALGTATVAQARSDVFFSIGANVAPGVSFDVSDYRQPVYVQPAPVYYQPAPVYYSQPQTYYYQPQTYYVQPEPVYYQPRLVAYSAPVTYVRPFHHRHHRHHYRY